jgi:2'-5' RNA ligase
MGDHRFMTTLPIQHVDEGRDHWWWRPGWRAGRHFYACHLTPADLPELRRLVGTYQAALREVPTVDLIPAQWLHLTMQGIGFTDEISSQEIERVLQSLRERLLTVEPPTVTFHWPTVNHEAVYLLAQPPEPLKRLRLAAYDAIAAELDPGKFQEQRSAVDRYHPHVSVVYINADGPTEPIVDAIGDLDPATLQPATVTFTQASLLVFHRDHQMYEWTRAEPIPIGVGSDDPRSR